MNNLCKCGCGKETTINQNSKKYNIFIKGHNSPWLGKNHSEKTKLKLSENHKGIKFSIKHKLKLSQNHIGFLGKKLSKEHKLKLFKSRIGKKHTEAVKLKISKANTGKIRSDESKLKMSISNIKRIEKVFFNGEPMYPGIGKNETSILNQIENSIGIKLLRNNHNLALKIGKFCDGYYPQFNLPIEVLESAHFKVNNELSKYDQNREVLIASRLGCMIYYISEKEFLNNPEKEIQRFKDFLELLRN